MLKPKARSTLPHTHAHLCPEDYVAQACGCYFYVLACRNGAYYTGIARDVAKRWQQHSTGKGAQYTRMHPPLALCFVMMCDDRSAALKAEYAFKQLSRPEKSAWLAQALA